MKLTTATQVSVDGVMQGCGGPDEDRSGGFERGGWAMGHFDNEVMTVCQYFGNRRIKAVDRPLLAAWRGLMVRGWPSPPP
jgi:hypothetical protein